MAVNDRLKESLIGAAGLARTTGRLLRRTATPAARHAMAFVRSRLATDPPAAPPPPRAGEPSPAQPPGPVPATDTGAATPTPSAKPPSPADVARHIHPHPPQSPGGAVEPGPRKKPAATRSKPDSPGAKLPPRKPRSTGG